MSADNAGGTPGSNDSGNNGNNGNNGSSDGADPVGGLPPDVPAAADASAGSEAPAHDPVGDLNGDFYYRGPTLGPDGELVYPVPGQIPGVGIEVALDDDGDSLAFTDRADLARERDSDALWALVADMDTDGGRPFAR